MGQLSWIIPVQRFRFFSYLSQNGRRGGIFACSGYKNRFLSSVVESSELDEVPDKSKVAEKATVLHATLSQLSDSGDFDRASMLWLQRFSRSQRAFVIPTSSLNLDLALRIGGLPKGRMVEVYGKEVGFLRSSWFHSIPARETSDCSSKSDNSLSQDGVASPKLKRKKLKGKRAVVRWLKFFRWKKKKECERMTAEEKILYKLRKARKKEERLMETMKKLEPAESSETTHDPEILTPEEHFYYLKMGLKCKNYVPVGRRGIYQGVILNMHLHWKKHQTLQVVIKTFTPDEVKEIAVELARLTGGIVLDVHEENTIIMYRGKNYVQPPTEIMSPRITLPRKKALDKSKCRDALRAVRKYIPRLEQELQLLQAQAETERGYPNAKVDDTQEGLVQRSEELKKIIERSQECLEEEDESELPMDSDLSDIFETDSESENEKTERPLFLEEFEKFPAINREDEDFVDPWKAKSGDGEEKDESPDFDEVDKMFLRAASLLKKKRR